MPLDNVASSQMTYASSTIEHGSQPLAGLGDGRRHSILRMASICAIGSWFALLVCYRIGGPSLIGAEALRANVAFALPSTSVRSLPVGLLALDWLTQHAMGRTEWSLRLPYGLAGIGLILSLYVLVQRRFGYVAGICTAAVFSVNPLILHHSRHVGPFVFESLTAALLILTWPYRAREGGRTGLGAFTIIAVVALGTTYTAPLVIIPLLCVSAVQLRQEESDFVTAKWISYSAMAALLLLACIAWYWWFSGALSISPDRTEEVAFRLVPAGVNPSEMASWGWQMCIGLFGLGTFAVTTPVWAQGVSAGAYLLAYTIGLSTIWHVERGWIWLMGIVSAAAWLTVVADHQLTEAMQTTSFVLPFVLIPVGVGLGRMVQARTRRILAYFVTVCAIAPWLFVATTAMADREQPGDLRAVLEYLHQNRSTGEALIIHSPLQDVFSFYGTDISAPVYIQQAVSITNLRRSNLFFQQFDKILAQNGSAWYIHLGGKRDGGMSYLTMLIEYCKEEDIYAIGKTYRLSDVTAILVHDRAEPND